MKLKLIHKLLIAMFACTALVLVLITLLTRASIGRGFTDFLQQQEQSRLQQLVPELAGWYALQGSWDELRNDPRQFYNLVFMTLLQDSENRLESGSVQNQSVQNQSAHSEPQPKRSGLREGRRGSGLPGSAGPGKQQSRLAGRSRGGPGPGPGGRISLAQRIFLLDGQKNPLIGQVPPGEDAEDSIPVKVNGATVGWLGIASIRGTHLPEEEAFIRQLRNRLLLGLGLGLVVAALLAWLLARHLSRPVNEVAEGIRALAAGNFETRLETRSSDEIARLGDDVNRLALALSEHETARRRWMSDIAHELRTPLSIISGELEAMSDGVRPLDKEQLASVREEVKHLASLIDDLHSLTLTDSGALAYKMQPVDLNELLQMAADSFQVRAAKKDLDLGYSGPGQAVMLQGDEQRLRQLLRNLLDNSLRYTDAGGRISMILTKDRQQAQFTISDTAPGASESECAQLFERLFRMEGSRNRNSGGSGLGLAICRNIVEAHGGSITAKPGPDGGLMITTTLPLNT